MGVFSTLNLYSYLKAGSLFQLAYSGELGLATAIYLLIVFVYTIWKENETTRY